MHQSSTYPIAWQPREVKPPVGQVDLSKVFFDILYKQIGKIQTSSLDTLSPDVVFGLKWMRLIFNF